MGGIVTQDMLNAQEYEMNKLDMEAQTGWQSWLKPIGVGVSAVNMGLNIGMYGDQKDSLKAKTNLANEKITDLKTERDYRTKTRANNTRVML